MPMATAAGKARKRRRKSTKRWDQATVPGTKTLSHRPPRPRPAPDRWLRARLGMPAALPWRRGLQPGCPARLVATAQESGVRLGDRVGDLGCWRGDEVAPLGNRGASRARG